VFLKRIFLLSSSILMAGFSYSVLHVRAASEGMYTADQAKRGGTLYQAQCSSCHGSDLSGVGQNPPLSGDEFLSKYEGEPIVALFDKIQTTMPATHPGSLARPQTADIISFILSSNKYLPGSTELPSDEENLKKIQLEKPPQ
jgi:mono/diheme cytochrome c family protein